MADDAATIKKAIMDGFAAVLKQIGQGGEGQAGGDTPFSLQSDPAKRAAGLASDIEQVTLEIKKAAAIGDTIVRTEKLLELKDKFFEGLTKHFLLNKFSMHITPKKFISIQ